MGETVLVGQKFGHWSVLDRVLRPEGVSLKGHQCLCVCECGAIRSIARYALLHGRSKSCGCHKTSYVHPAKLHGLSQTVEYATWKNMHSRCYNPKAVNYKHYGAKGITICEAWKSFEAFYADMGKRPDGTTLDRKDGKKGYCKENCRWATPTEQSNNLSSNKFYSHNGESKTLSQWAKLYKINLCTLKHRLLTGVPMAMALSEAPHTLGKRPDNSSPKDFHEKSNP